jgi:FSR family fosmidomycin resistance protein-like MFS transporter
MTALPDTPRAADTTVVTVVQAVALGHLLNDVMQSLIPAVYPLLKDNIGLTFAQIGLITLVFQGTASILQPLVGLYTDRRPLPYALASAMLATGAGLVLLAQAESLGTVLAAVALIGVGSSIFHPEASRIARLAAGMRPGFAQALFQVGGNAGTALGPLAAAFVVLPRGQASLAWFTGVAMLGFVLLFAVCRWYVAEGAGRARARRAVAAAEAPPAAAVRLGMAVLVVVMTAKFVYSVSFSSYYTFWLIDRFGLSAQQAQGALFAYLAAVAVGTIIGGPVGDRIGRRAVILWSVAGILPLSLAAPWLPLAANVVVSSAAGLILASAFPAMVVYAQDLMPRHTGMVAGLLFGLAFGVAAVGAGVLGLLADARGIHAVFVLCSALPVLGLAALWLPALSLPALSLPAGRMR